MVGICKLIHLIRRAALLVNISRGKNSGGPAVYPLGSTALDGKDSAVGAFKVKALVLVLVLIALFRAMVAKTGENIGVAALAACHIVQFRVKTLLSLLVHAQHAAAVVSYNNHVSVVRIKHAFDRAFRLIFLVFVYKHCTTPLFTAKPPIFCNLYYSILYLLRTAFFRADLQNNAQTKKFIFAIDKR